ncbi:hypothetical protein ACLB2K_020115 [Fragaria x ananassa]
MRSKKVRVKVEKKLSDPILTSKTIKLATDAEEQIDFYFENCLSICHACNLVFHENGKCQANSSYNIAGQSHADITSNPAPVISFASKALMHGAFKFHGSRMPSSPMAALIFDKKKQEKTHKRPTILKKPAREPEDDAPTIIQVNDPDHSSNQTSPEYEPKGDLTVGEERKRGRPSSPETLPQEVEGLERLIAGT